MIFSIFQYHIIVRRASHKCIISISMAIASASRKWRSEHCPLTNRASMNCNRQVTSNCYILRHDDDDDDELYFRMRFYFFMYVVVLVLCSDD